MNGVSPSAQPKTTHFQRIGTEFEPNKLADDTPTPGYGLEEYTPTIEEHEGVDGNGATLNQKLCSIDFCNCFFWQRPSQPPWMDLVVGKVTPERDGSANLRRSLSYANLLYGLNLLAAIGHLCGLVVVYSKAKGPVEVELWTSKAVFARPDLNDLRAGNATIVFDFIPQYELSAHPPKVSLRDLTGAFFALSFAAHFFVVVSGGYLSIYYWWIDQCRQPLRWIEYFFSSTCMIVVIAAFCGVRDASIMLAVATLNAVTMIFGWVTEALSRPYDGVGGRSIMRGYSKRRSADKSRGGDVVSGPVVAVGAFREWDISATRPATIVFACSSDPTYLGVAATLQRLFPWVLGCIPYAVCWYILFAFFFDSTEDARKRGILPTFVDVIVWSEFVLFSLFALVVLWVQGRANGPQSYYAGEIAFLVLSLVAKLTLGIILVTQVFIASSFEDIFDVDRYIEAEEKRIRDAERAGRVLRAVARRLSPASIAWVDATSSGGRI